jgi:hypothetical protein
MVKKRILLQDESIHEIDKKENYMHKERFWDLLRGVS